MAKTMAAEPSLQLTQYIESFVDKSRSPPQQAASLDAIVSLLKKDVLSIASLVRKMEMYLTTADDILRARGILLLGEAVACIPSKALDSATVHSLITFFAERLADWRALRGALVGCLALMRRESNGVVTGSDAKMVAQSYLQTLQVQSLAQHDRKLCFELLECLLEHHPAHIASLGDGLVYGICEAIDGEKDPQCLMLAFHNVEILVQLFPDPSGPLESFAGDLFGLLGCYFPIHFTHPKAVDLDVKRDDLSRALMHAFSSTPLFEPFAMPLLIEKLSSSLPSAKVDSLKYISYCAYKYGAERMAKHANNLWTLLKDSASVKELVLSFGTESLDDLDSQENEIVTEAQALLEKLIVQNGDLYLSFINGDGDINMIFDNIINYKNYNEIDVESKKKLFAIGCILHIAAKASVASCSRVFGSYFPRLMEALGLSVENASGDCNLDGNYVISRKPNYGALYLCIQFLEACRVLIVDNKDLMMQCISAKEMWCCLLQCFSTSLSKIFSSTWATNPAEPANDADIYLGVKGLQTLATFPGGFLLIPKSTFEDILMAFVSILMSNFDKTFLWKLALKALVHIGISTHGCNESEKTMSYMDIIVEKIISLVSSDDFIIPLPLLLEIISDIGSCGLEYMLKIVQGMQEVIHANLGNVYVQGNLKSARITLQLLECFSQKLLPWIQENEGFEEVLLALVVNMWNQIDDYLALTTGVNQRELLEATMTVMKLAVAFCSVESQNIIVDKAYLVLSSSNSLPLKESLFAMPVQLEQLEPTQESDKHYNRDEWVLSLFASVVMALHPRTHIPDMRRVLHLFMTALLKGNVSAAQALGSLVNKLDSEFKGTDLSGDCTFEEVMDIIFNTNICSSFDNGPLERCGTMSNGNEMSLANLCLGAIKSRLLQIHAIVGLAWIGKGLLMRGHEKVGDITMVFLECLLSNDGMSVLPLKQGLPENNHDQDVHLSVMKRAADAFQILMSDSEICLNRKFHAIVRPLYKQRFFSTMMPILQSLIAKSESSFSRSTLHRAFAHIISDTPLIVILNDAKKLITMLLDGLTLLSKDAVDKDIVYSLLLVLSGILTDKNGQEAVVDDAHIIINCLVGLIAYPHMMVVRETAIQCLVAMSELPHTRIYPMRIQVLHAVSKALDDPKRTVRQEAVRCRRAWSVN